MTYFVPTPKTLEELKALYRKLAMIHHPDKGGNVETMKAINNEYDKLFDSVKNLHRNAVGETYEKETTETAKYFRDIINALFSLKMDGVTVELIGSFLWLTGNTKQYKDDIKALGFKWSNNKLSWYMSPPGYKKHNNKQYSLTDIRYMFGSESIKDDRSTLALA